MSWSEVYKVNSDIQGEPLNFLNYLNDLKLNELDSYVLYDGNIRIWEELYLNSLYLFSNRGIREVAYAAFSETDIDNLFDKSTKLGEQLNAFYRTDIFSLGNADNVVKGMTIEHYNSLEEKFKAGYDRYVTREQEKSTIGAWFNSTFSLNNTDLESLTTINEILTNTEATNAILNNSNAIVALTMCKSSMDAVVASSSAMDLLGQYILRVTAEPPVIKAIIKNPVIRDAIINSSEAMTQIATNENSVIEIFSDLEATKTLLGNKNSINEIIKNNEVAKEIIPKMLTMKTTTANNRNYRNNIETALNSISNQFDLLNYKNDIFPAVKQSKEIFDDIKVNNNILGEEFNRQMEIANAISENEELFKNLANIPSCMDTIAKSPTIMNHVTNRANIMNAFANSSTAMSILANNPNAMSYIKNSSTAMTEIVKSAIAMTHIVGNSNASEQIVNNSLAFNMVLNNSSAIDMAMRSAIMLREMCKLESASIAIAEKIQNCSREAIRATLNSSNVFTKVTTNIGNGNGTFDDGIGTNTIYIPISCYDDGDTSFLAYYGCKNSLVVVPTINKHSGSVEISAGVSLRGVRVVGSGNSVGYMIFDKYTAK